MTDSTTGEDAPEPDSDGSILNNESLDLADGTRGKRELQLYLISLPFWIVAIWLIPELTEQVIGEEAVITVTAAVAGAGAVVTAAVILRLGVGYRDRLRMTLLAYAIPFWLMVMWYAHSQMMARGRYTLIFFGGLISLYMVMEVGDAIEDKDYLDISALAASAVIIGITCFYLFVNFQAIRVEGLGRATTFELTLAFLFTLSMIFLTWRSFGVTFLVVVLAGIGYGFAGPFIPGTLGHGGLTVDRTLRILVISIDGFLGFLTQLVAAWIALFLLYAGLLKSYGAFDLILRLAVRTAKYIDSGIAQTAVLASAVIGSVNGSQTANAGMTGSFTIPLMMKSDVEPETAGGIEAVASTSGQVLPPVMGAGAFIMASLITGVTYVDVIVAGLIPAAVLVVSIIIAVHYVAAPQISDPEMTGVFDQKLSQRDVLFEGTKYGVPLLILVYVLGVLQFTVMTAALWTAISMIAFGIGIPLLQTAVEDESTDYWETFVETIKQTIDGLREGVIVTAPVTIILAAINGVVDILMATGVPTAISLALIDLSGGVLIIAAILSMIICIILGLGMPTTAAYTVVALLVAPTLTGQFFLPEFSAHFFVFYAAILAGLTPPIATCVAVTCGISGGGFWTSCKEAMKISAPLFLLPFSFIYHPEIVSGEFTAAALVAGVFALVGAIAVIHGINYQFQFAQVANYGFSAAFFAFGIVAMAHPERMVQTGATVGIALLYAVQTLVGKPDPVGTIRATITGITGRGKAREP